VGSYAEFLKREKARMKFIKMCGRSFLATIQSAKCASARWQAKCIIAGAGLAIG
jgi:hypothetical protein